MVTKGIITSIDFNGNTCQVRIPLFETASNDPIISTAIVSNTPGSYNGYKVGDVVLVAFEDGKMETPVVIGKLYLGAEKEKADPRGSLNTESLVAAKTAAVPADTKLTTNTDKNLPNTMNPYANLSSIANNLNKLNTDVNYLDVFTNNQFSSVITDVNKQGEELRSEIKQTASNIEAKVDKKHDSTTTSLGWNLTDTKWTIDATNTDWSPNKLTLFEVDRNGQVIINGNVRIGGYPQSRTRFYKKLAAGSESPKAPDMNTATEELPDKGWRETYEWENTYHIWETIQTIIYDTNTNDKGELQLKITYSTPVDITGAAGEQGISIKSQIIYYAMVDSDITHVEKPDYVPKGGSNQDNHVYGNSNGGNIIDLTAASPVKGYGWSVTPHEYIDGWNYYTSVLTIYSDDNQAVSPAINHRNFADPVKAQELDGVYELAQGKSKNYYSEIDPAGTRGNDAYGLTMRKGYCWFDTGYTQISTPKAKSGYLGKWLRIQDANGNYVVKSGENPVRLIQWKDGITDQRYNMIKVGPDNIDTLISNKTIVVGTTEAFETGNLKQWNGTDWVDISGELVTNKLTANYINAMDITAKKITVLDKTSKNPIFIAGETGSNGKQMNIIGGFKIDENSISSNKTYANSRFNLAIKTNKYKYYQTNIPANDELKYVVAKIRFKKAQSRFILYTRSNSFTAEGTDGSFGTLKNYVLSVTNNGSVRNLTLPLLLSDKNIVNSTAYRVSTDPTGDNIGDWSKIPFNEYTAAIYHNLKENDCIYIVFVKNIIETDENTVAQAINGAFLIPEYQPDDPETGDTTDDILEVDLAPASIPGIQNAGNTSYSRITDANKIFNIWEIDNKINYIYNNASSLQLGAKFSAYSDGEVYAKSGQLGPWDIANNRCNFNYFGTGEKNGVKYEEWYKQENAAWWDGDGITFTCKKATDNNWIQDHNEYHSMPNYTATTKISAVNGVTATNFYRLLYNNKERYKYTASKKGHELNKDAYWRRASLMASISNDMVTYTAAGKEQAVSGLAINAIATFKVKIPSKTGDPALSGSGWYTISGIDAYNNALDNIKPCCGICIRRVLYTRKINGKEYTDIVREVDCTGIKIWLIESNNKYIPNISVYYNKLAKIKDADTSYYNDEIDVIIFGTAMNFVNNSNV